MNYKPLVIMLIMVLSLSGAYAYQKNTHSQALVSNGNSLLVGFNVTANYDINICVVEQSSNSNMPYAYILGNGYVPIQNATFSGVNATFSPCVNISGGQKFSVVAGLLNDDTNRAAGYTNGVTFPFTGAATPALNWTKLVYQNADNSFSSSTTLAQAVLNIYTENITSSTTADSLGYTNLSKSGHVPNTTAFFYVTFQSTNSQNLTNYTFSTNLTGAWVNNSVVTITGKNYSAIETLTLPVTLGINVCGKFYFQSQNTTTTLTNETTNICTTTAQTPNGIANFTLYPNNPVGSRFYAYEDETTAKAEWNMLPGVISGGKQYIDMWYHTNAASNYIAYWNGTNPYNFSDGSGTITNLAGYYAPAVIVNNSQYLMYVAKSSDNDIYAFTSTNKINWTAACGGAAVIGGLNTNTAAQMVNGVIYIMVQQQAGTWNIVGYNSSDGCSLSSMGTLLTNEYNPWFNYFNGTWVFAVSSPNSTNYNLRSYKGNLLTNLTYDKTLIQLPAQPAWDLNHLGDGYMYIIDDNATQYYDKKLYYFYGGNNSIGVAYDTDNRSFYDIFDVQRNTQISSLITPTFSAPTPPEGYITNGQVTINITTYDYGTYYNLWLDNTTNPTTLVLNNASLNYYTTSVDSSTKTYYYKAGTWNSSLGFSPNTSVYSWVHDETAPTITLNPTNEFNAQNYTLYDSYDGNVRLNISASDERNVYGITINITRGSSSLYSYVNNTLNGTSNTFSVNINSNSWVASKYNVSIVVTDGNGSAVLNSRTYNYFFYVGNYTTSDNSVVVSLESYDYVLNISNDSTIKSISPKLYYNGSILTPTVSTYGLLNTYTVNTITPNTTGTLSYYWNVTITQGDDNVSNTIIYRNQSIELWSLVPCGSNPAITFNLYNEDYPQLSLNGTFETEIYYWINDFTTAKLFNYSFPSSNTFSVCLSNSSSVLRANIYARNTVPGGFTHRFYVQNGTYSNTTTVYNIYNTNDTTGYTDLKLTTRYVSNYDFFENVFVSLQRKYLSEGVYRTVQMDKSGDYGLVFFDIKEENTDYKLLFYDENNNLLKETDVLKFVCTAGVCDITQLLNPAGTTTATINGSANVDYNNNTGIVTIDWSSLEPSGSTATIKVLKEGMSSTTTICNVAQTGNAGTYDCNVTGYTGDVQVLVTVDGENKLSEWLTLEHETLSDFLDVGEQSIITFIIMVTIISFGIFSPVGLVLSTMFGLMTIFFLGIFSPVNLAFIIIAVVASVVISVKVKT